LIWANSRLRIGHEFLRRMINAPRRSCQEAGDPGIWAALGNGCDARGTMRAPFTAIAFMLEVTMT